MRISGTVAAIACAAAFGFGVAGHAFASQHAAPIADPTGFGSNVPEVVHVVPLQHLTNGGSMKQVKCAAGSPGTTCYIAG